jgi:formyl-CoA transferase
MALLERHRSGRGQYLDMTLYDCGISLLYPQASRYLLDGIRPMPTGNSHPIHTPCGKYKTKNGEVFITVANDAQFKRLAQQMGMPELALDERFATIASRQRHQAELSDIISGVIADQDCETFALRLLRAGVSASPILHVDQVLGSEQAMVREMVVQRDDYRGLGTPIKMSRTPGGVRRGAPRFAEDTEEILGEAGYTGAEIEQLEAAGAVYTTRTVTHPD